ncbi:MAG: PD-(D/E)XK nuclease family protein [Gammaproteobacteria bacterium]|nr:PD-(D/E)XK nuclease family protein [Gammaproteobacteria bacterium]
MTNNTDTKRLQSFLDQFRLIKEKHDEVARANGEWFNVFSVLGVESAEIRHSAFLAELLNPNGSHSQGAVFLRLFFEMLRTSFGKKFDWELSLDEIGGFEVTAEAHQGDYGRIDILIKTRDKCMVIENKIYAGDQERQLGRYYDYAKANWSEANIAVIYLTLDGKEPDNYTLYGNETRGGSDLIKSEYVLCVSYKHLIDWLDDCLKETVRLAHIRETLFQYQSLLKQLTGQTLNRRFMMDTNELFSKDNYRLIPELEEAIFEFKTHIENRLWVEICDKLKNSGEQTGINIGDAGLDEQLKVIENTIKNNRTPSAHGKGDYGLTLPIENSDIDFAIFAEYAYNAKIFFFFKKRDEEKGKEILSEERVDWNGKYKDAMNEKELVFDKWYLCWKYYKYNGKELRLSFDALCAENAVNDLLNERDKIVEDIVKQSHDIINCFFGKD